MSPRFKDPTTRGYTILRVGLPNQSIQYCPILGINTLAKDKDPSWRGPGAYDSEKPSTTRSSFTTARNTGTSSFLTVDRDQQSYIETLPIKEVPIGAYHLEGSMIKRSFNVKMYK